MIPFELEALSKAKRYQTWLVEQVMPYLGNRILEVGSGTGNLSLKLPLRERLLLTETDPELLTHLQARVQETWGNQPGDLQKLRIDRFDVLKDSLEPYKDEGIDTIVSFNVLEHFEDDALALRRFAEILVDDSRSMNSNKMTKRIISVVPAHEFAFGAMDKAFGHYRRYDGGQFKKLTQRIIPQARVHARYFNRVGLMGWWVNGRILKRSEIGDASIRTYERLCPAIRFFDQWVCDPLRLPFGQSLLTVIEIPSKSKKS